MTDLTTWLSISVAAVVACIGLLQLLTAREQARTANNRAVFDLFEKRYAVYQTMRQVVSKVTTQGRADAEMFLDAGDAAEKAKFLFGEEIVGYLDQFTRDIIDLGSLGKEQSDLQGDDLKKNLDAQRQIKNRFVRFYN